jgi:hypothetical protein
MQHSNRPEAAMRTKRVLEGQRSVVAGRKAEQNPVHSRGAIGQQFNKRTEGAATFGFWLNKKKGAPPKKRWLSAVRYRGNLGNLPRIGASGDRLRGAVAAGDKKLTSGAVSPGATFGQAAWELVRNWP